MVTDVSVPKEMQHIGWREYAKLLHSDSTVFIELIRPAPGEVLGVIGWIRRRLFDHG